MKAAKAVSLGLTALIILVVWQSYCAKQRHEARRQLLDFRAAIRLGASPTEVEQQLDPIRYNKLTLYHIDASHWIVTTPAELGARDWCLFLDFVDRSLREVRVRTSDRADVRPTGAPEDIRSDTIKR